MTTISALFADRGSGPYSKAIKVKVVAREERPQSYRAKDGTQKRSLTSGVSDGEKVIKVVCYDTNKFNKFQVGNSLVMREVIRKSEEEKYLVITSVSKVLIAAPMEVPETHAEEGRRLVNPPPADKVAISTALQSPLKKKMTIEGKIVQEEQPRNVNCRGEDVQIKVITVEDKTGKAKVSLWREISETEARAGDHVEITDVVINVYNNTTTLNTTGRSKVVPCEAPVETRIVTVEAVGCENGEAELFLVDGTSITMPAELLEQALSGNGEQVNIEMATVDGPITLKVMSRGREVTSVVVE